MDFVVEYMFLLGLFPSKLQPLKTKVVSSGPTDPAITFMCVCKVKRKVPNGPQRLSLLVKIVCQREVILTLTDKCERCSRDFVLICSSKEWCKACSCLKKTNFMPHNIVFVVEYIADCQYIDITLGLKIKIQVYYDMIEEFNQTFYFVAL